MALTRQQKQEILEDLKGKIARQKIIIFVDIAKIKVKDISDLRKKLKTIDSELKVAKKTLSKIAFKEKKFEIDTKKLQGEIALILGYKEEILPTKIVYQFSQENPDLKILGGCFENKFVVAEKIIELAQIPTKEELLARVIGGISAPISNFVDVLHGNLRNLVRILSQLKVT